MQQAEVQKSVLPIQPMTAGTGPEYHRIFSVDLDVRELMAMKAMAQLKADPNSCAAQLISTFEKTKGEAGTLAVGDEFNVHGLLGTQAPVRVSHVDKHGFVLQTLAGHIEAGEARMSLKQNGEDRMRFEVELLSRSRDKLIDVLYDIIPLAKIVQSVTWIEFCENFANNARRFADLQPSAEWAVKVTTHRKAEDTHNWVTLEND